MSQALLPSHVVLGASNAHVSGALLFLERPPACSRARVLGVLCVCVPARLRWPARRSGDGTRSSIFFSCSHRPPVQADTIQAYLNAIERTMTATLCLQNFGSQRVERHNKPEVEMQSDKELLLTPLVISRDKVRELCAEEKRS